LGQFSKNYRSFYPKNCHEAPKNMGLGSGIWDPGSGIRDPEKTYSGSRIQWSKRHRIPIPDSGSGSATLRSNVVQNLSLKKLSTTSYLTPWSVGTRRRPSERRAPCRRWPAGGPRAGRSWNAAFGAMGSARSLSCPSGTAGPSSTAPLPGN
jgi:hypothetical protein